MTTLRPRSALPALGLVLLLAGPAPGQDAPPPPRPGSQFVPPAAVQGDLDSLPRPMG